MNIHPDSTDADLPLSIQDWLGAHPIQQPRQVGPIPLGWSSVVLQALSALDVIGVQVAVCKFKLGSLRMRVRTPGSLDAEVAGTAEHIIATAQERCAQACTRCGARLTQPGDDIDGATCDLCAGC